MIKYMASQSVWGKIKSIMGIGLWMVIAISGRALQASLSKKLRKAWRSSYKLSRSRSLRWGAFCVIWEGQRHVKRKIQLGRQREGAAEGPQCLGPCHHEDFALYSEIRGKPLENL